jgi:hypothetical protein
MHDRSLSGSRYEGGLAFSSSSAIVCSRRATSARLGREFRIFDGDEFTGLGQFIVTSRETIRQRNDLEEALVLAAQGRAQLRVAKGPGIGQLLLDGGGPFDRRRETCPDAQVFFFPAAYFCRKRSTRPAVSTSFCFPV